MVTDLLSWFKALGPLGRSSQTCSPETYAMVYSMGIWAVVVSVGGFYVWRRFIRTQPGVKVRGVSLI